LTSVESLSVLTSQDNRFGAGSASPYSYVIATADGNVPGGTQLKINASTLIAGESFTFNGSAETNGSFFIYAGRGTDDLTGGGGNDTFYFAEGGRWGVNDHVDGRGGSDIIVLRGDYNGSASVEFADGDFENVETLSLLSAFDARFGALGERYSYEVTLANGNVAAGATFTVNGSKLTATETMTIDGSAETNGHLRLLAGAGDDVLIGGGGNDLIHGGLGADTMTGGGGNDTFRYQAVEDSTPTARDGIQDFASGDKIDLSRIDAIASSSVNDGFTFIGSNAFSNTAGELRAVNTGIIWTISGDIDGDGVADIELVLVVTDGDPITAIDFML